MKIPVSSKNEHSTLSTTQLRAYGAGDFSMELAETERGCPRQYKARYVDKVVKDERGFPLVYGSYVHEVLFRMEEEQIDMEDALIRHLPPELGPEHMKEARDDIVAYMERGSSPMDLYGTVAVEQDLHALLYVDEEFGPVYFRGIIDWMGVDLDNPMVLHFVDYKTNRTPPSRRDVQADIQLKGYHWLVKQHAEQYGAKAVVAHLDAIKWFDVEVRFTDAEIEEWHAWCIAVARRILRDEEAKPRVNPSCNWCPVKADCPAFKALPQIGQSMLGLAPEGGDEAEWLRWRDNANRVKLLLGKEITAVDERLKGIALRNGGAEIGDTRFEVVTDWKDEIDLRRLHDVLGDGFYDVVRSSKSAVESAAKDFEPHMLARVRKCIERVPVGAKVVKKKIEKEE